MVLFRRPVIKLAAPCLDVKRNWLNHNEVRATAHGADGQQQKEDTH